MLALYTTVITDFVSHVIVIEFKIAAASAYLIIMKSISHIPSRPN